MGIMLTRDTRAFLVQGLGVCFDLWVLKTGCLEACMLLKGGDGFQKGSLSVSLWAFCRKERVT